MEPWVVTKKLYTSVAVTPAPVSTLRLLVPSFTSAVGYAENFSPCSYVVTGVHGAMDCDRKGYTPVWRWHQLLLGSLTYGRLFPLSHRLLTRPKTFHLALVEEVILLLLLLLLLAVLFSTPISQPRYYSYDPQNSIFLIILSKWNREWSTPNLSRTTTNFNGLDW